MPRKTPISLSANMKEASGEALDASIVRRPTFRRQGGNNGIAAGEAAFAAIRQARVL